MEGFQYNIIGGIQAKISYGNKESSYGVYKKLFSMATKLSCFFQRHSSFSISPLNNKKGTSLIYCHIQGRSESQSRSGSWSRSRSRSESRSGSHSRSRSWSRSGSRSESHSRSRSLSRSGSRCESQSKSPFRSRSRSRSKSGYARLS